MSYLDKMKRALSSREKSGRSEGSPLPDAVISLASLISHQGQSADPHSPRILAFRRQYSAWRGEGRAFTADQIGLPGRPHPALPAFVIPNIKPTAGSCFSCGEPVSSGTLRCSPCVDAIRVVLEEIEDGGR